MGRAYHSRFGNRLDSNQTAIIKEILRIPGVSVLRLNAVKSGCPDIMVGWRGKNWLFEIWSPDKKHLTADEIAFQNVWTGNYANVRTAEEILVIIGAIKERVV